MSILQPPRRDEQPPEKVFFRINYQFEFILGVWGLRFCTVSAKKSGSSELHLTCSEAKLFLFGLVLFLHICSDCIGRSFESSAKSSLVGSPNCLVRAQTKDSNEMTFFEAFSFKFFSRLWEENNEQTCQTLVLRVQRNLLRMRFNSK